MLNGICEIARVQLNENAPNSLEKLEHNKGKLKQDLEILNLIKSMLEIKSECIGIYDIYIKGTNTIFMYEENDNYDLVVRWLRND